MRDGTDIPGRVVAAFVLALVGFMGSAVAGLFVAGDLIARGAQQDLVDSAVPTIVGLALPGGFGALGAAWVLLDDRLRLGRSLAWAAVILGAFSWLNLFGYGVRLREVDRDLDALRARIEQQQPVAGGLGGLPALTNVVSYPTGGTWREVDGDTGCSWELVDFGGVIFDAGTGAVVEVPSQIDAFRYEQGCVFERG